MPAFNHEVTGGTGDEAAAAAVATPHTSAEVRRCAHDVAEALDRHEWRPEGAYSDVLGHLELLARSPDLLEGGLPIVATTHSAEAKWLYWDGTINLLLARFAAHTPVPIHNHGTWQVVGTYRGQLSYQAYRRCDDQARPNYAEIEVTSDRILGPGEFELVPEPPDDIHGFTPVGDDDMWMLVLLYRKYDSLRLYFDPDTNRVDTQPHAYYKR